MKHELVNSPSLSISISCISLVILLLLSVWLILHLCYLWFYLRLRHLLYRFYCDNWSNWLGLNLWGLYIVHFSTSSNCLFICHKLFRGLCCNWFILFFLLLNDLLNWYGLLHLLNLLHCHGYVSSLWSGVFGNGFQNLLGSLLSFYYLNLSLWLRMRLNRSFVLFLLHWLRLWHSSHPV